MPDAERLSVRVVDAITELDAAAWDALAGSQPFVRHGFLAALEASGCVSPRTGWTPRHLALMDGLTMAAAMPLYLKDHSWGEYVFDWAWAEAHERVGLDYYPKLLCAIPFTPVPGPRLLARDDATRSALLSAALELARTSGASSFHLLFPDAPGLDACTRAGLSLREAVQFHWINRDFGNFEDYLASLSREKRKKIRQERRRVHEAGVRFRVLSGSAIGDEDWAFFHRCYCLTYRQHRSTPYLTLDFFRRLAAALPDAPVIVIASLEGADIAAALNLRDAQRLYGRYWGSLVALPGLHFETCYYQGIDYCIRHGLAAFEGGAQGEHKLARGFLPQTTFSAHWLRHATLANAVDRYLAREREAMGEYADELHERSPYRKPPGAGTSLPDGAGDGGA